MKLFSKYITQITLAMILILGFFLRVYPGFENIIWSYDQARDSVVIRSIIGEKNLMLVGPQTEFVGLSHGVLFYYLLAPFYFWGQSNLTLPVLAMIFINLSTVIPIYFLAKSLFKNSKAGLLAAFLFVISYQQVEYARWISNVSITIPFLAWFYYLLWSLLENKQLFLKTKNITKAIFTGLSLGLAIQGEIFLLYLIPLTYLLLYLKRIRFQQVAFFHLGLFLGLITFIIAELKFNFLATKTFFSQFLASNASNLINPSTSFSGYLDHLGLTTYQSVFGITASMGLLALILGLLTLFLLNKTIQNNSHPTALTYLLVLFFSHSILFSFKYIDAVFLDLPITIPLILLITLLIWSLIQNQKLLLALGIFLIAIITQLLQLKINTENQTPMQTYRFHQSTILFSQKKEIVKNIYGLVGNEKFTLGVMGTPYGVQTTWATIFENYLAENLNLPKPDWFGAHSIGYPYDSYFTKVDHPEKIHVVILEDNILALTNEVIVGNFLSHADESTTIIKAVEIDGFTIQIRSKKQ